MTPEQRERKKQADRERRARLKAQGLDAKAIRAGVKAAMKKPRPAAAAPTVKVSRKKELADINADLAKVFPGKPIKVDRNGQVVRNQHASRSAAPEGRMQVISFKGHTHHAEKLRRLGGGEFLRGAIEDAKE